ncbi:MAG: carboxypeptidase-like regulatory domain-containing protein [Bryobacteraceae bacterium]|jgi:hypothetical protein
MERVRCAGSRTLLLFFLPLLLVLLVLPASAQSRRRTVRGVVTGPYGMVLEGAVVRIKNTLTLRVRSYITQKDGRYRFQGLSPDVDYQLHANYRGATSPEKTVSRFDPRPIVEIDLRVEFTRTAGRASVPRP